MAQRLSRTQMMHRQLLNQTKSSISSLRAFFNEGDFKSTLQIGQEVIFLASGLETPHKYLVEAHHYLALIHVSVRRHDRAVNNVTEMVKAARASGDVTLFTKSLVTLGLIHIKFDHLDAACRAWEFLLPEVKDLIPKAWMLHEIGRCHLECGRYEKALKFSTQCQETAIKGNSKKWFLHGKLLCGQTLMKIGRFNDALESLKVAAVSDEEGDTPTLGYIQELINRVTGILRQSMLTIGSGESVPPKGPSIDSPREKCAFQRKILKDHSPFMDVLEDKMFLNKFDNEIGSIKKDDDEDCDLDAISNNSDQTYVIQKEQSQIPQKMFLSKTLLKEKTFFDSQIFNNDFSEKESNDDFMSQDSETDLRSKSKDSSGVWNVQKEEIESLFKELKFSERGNEKLTEEKFVDNNDWRLFLKNENLEDLVDATESIPTGRTYNLVATHALYRHSLPSSPRQ